MTRKTTPKPDGVLIKEFGDEISLVEVMNGIQTANKAHAKWTAEDRMRVVMTYIISGSSLKTAQATGVPATTIRDWKANAPWWDEVYSKAAQYYNNQMDAEMTSLMHDALGASKDRVKDGDYHVLRDGTLVRKPISGKDAIMIAAIAYDKRALSRGDPTSRTDKTSKDELIKSLVSKFEQVARKQKVVEGNIEVVKQDEDD